MSEWQPARVRLIHNPGVLHIPQRVIEAKMYRIRPTVREYRPDTRLLLDCDATLFFEVHPDDIFRGCGDLICEHEILTD